MTETRTLLLPQMPECWETCGACGDEVVLVAELLVAPGERLERDEPMLSLETDKTVLDIPSPWRGTVERWLVDEGDAVSPGDPILLLVCD